jgi:hypothetical protein
VDLNLCILNSRRTGWCVNGGWIPGQYGGVKAGHVRRRLMC